MNYIKPHISFNSAISIFIGIALFLTSCSNDIEKVKELTIRQNFPVLSADSMEIVRTDSSKIKLTAFAPLFERYIENDVPYTIFPDGIIVVGFNNYPDTAYSITSKYAIQYEQKKLWEARIDVEVISEEGDIINTEQLFWNEAKGIIYSDQFTRITNEEGVFYGEAGFEALENGTKWKLRNIKNSTVNVKDE